MPITSAEKNRQAKINFIKAFFDGLDTKIVFLDELYNTGYRDEARVLCSCYIDWLASALYWPEERNNFNFVRILKEQGGEEIFIYIHPKMLNDAFLKLIKRKNKKWTTIHKKISPKLQQSQEKLYAEQEIINLLSPLVANSEMEDIKKEMWRGTFAAIIYDRFRNPSVHAFGPSDGITFDNTTFKGQPVPSIEFPMLHKCLKRITAAVKEKSLKTEKWFGHDYE